MRDLSDSDILEAWERGQSRHPIDQALAILAVVGPEMSHDELVRMSVGERDGRLIDVYARLFGQGLTAAACCERCHEELEFAFSIDDVRVASKRHDESPYTLGVGSYYLEFRVPDSLDLADIASGATRFTDLADARARLADRCVLRATKAGATVATSELPAEVIAALAAEMQTRDPQADVTLTTTCPKCERTLALSFDIVTFLWAKIALRARQLLHEVHQLARAYGWREDDVLALGGPRRRAYLALLA